MSEEKINPGYVPEQIPETAAIYNRVFGAGTGIRASKDWRPFFRPHKVQGWLPFCVSFARVAVARARAYFDGEDIDFSCRVLAVESKTTHAGNTLEAVNEWFRKMGDVLSSIVELTQREITYSGVDIWSEIFTLPNLSAARRYLGGNHSWVFGRAAMVDALDYGPLQIAMGIGNTWGQGGIIKQPAHITDYHSVALAYIDELGYMYVQDSLGGSDEWKTLEPGYPLTGAKSFRDLPENWKELNMGKTLGIQFGPDPTIYVQVGNSLQLVPCADWNAFVNVGGSADSIVPFPAESKSKFQVVTHDLFKSE